MEDENRYISVFLKEARKRAGLTAKEASSKLAEMDIKLSGVTINGYENNRSIPDAEKFLALCSIYDVSNPIPYIVEILDRGGGYYTLEEKLEFDEAARLSDKAKEVMSLSKATLTLKERQLLEDYRNLNSDNQGLISQLTSLLVKAQLYEQFESSDGEDIDE